MTNTPEVYSRSRSFDIKTVLMIVMGDNLGESHIAQNIVDLLQHLFGHNFSIVDSQESHHKVLQQAGEHLLQQYPQLHELICQLDELPDEQARNDYVRNLPDIQLGIDACN